MQICQKHFPEYLTVRLKSIQCILMMTSLLFKTLKNRLLVTVSVKKNFEAIWITYIHINESK